MAQEQDDHLPQKSNSESGKKKRFPPGDPPLDPTILDALRAAERFDDSPLLDDTPLGLPDSLLDNSPLDEATSDQPRELPESADTTLASSGPPPLPQGAYIMNGSDATGTEPPPEDGNEEEEE